MAGCSIVSGFEHARNEVAKNQTLEKVLVSLDVNGVSDVWMECSQANEDELFDAAVQMTPARRNAITTIRASLCDLPRTEVQTVISQALLLLDAYCSRQRLALTAESESSFPALCMSVVRLVCKIQCSRKSFDLMTTRWLSLIPSATTADLDEHEQSVLVTMRWKVVVTTIDQWAEAMLKRIDIIAIDAGGSSIFRPYLEPLLELTSQLCAAIMMSCVNSPDFMPFNVAQGIVSLSLVASGVIPAAALGLIPNTASLSDFPLNCQRFEPTREETLLLLASLFAGCCANALDLRKSTQLVIAKIRPRIEDRVIVGR